MQYPPVSTRPPRTAHWLAALSIAIVSAAAIGQQQADPPARVAALSHLEGSVVFAPAGETDWGEAALNRPITNGDRLWTDQGARAELHLGSSALQMDSTTFVEVVALDDEVLQANLKEGVVDARVRQLDGGENFEIDTPQLAFRAAQPGDFRLDVDPVGGTTRVTVRSGAATVQGSGGGVVTLQAGQQVAFGGRNLEQVPQATLVEDGFDRWALSRNRAEDASVTARYVPRDVVGYQELDTSGTWSVDANYGAVWYPRVAVADWAPYRYGRWEWVDPWGWTWLDDAAWGFAPFHYGRWAMIDSRWAWVPGRIGPRPVYSPALVVFMGGGGSTIAGRGPGIAWYPLAPGEAWRPVYRTSINYLRNVNRNVVVNAGWNGSYLHQRMPGAITAVRTEDFNRGRVNTHWARVNPGDLGRAQVATQADLPRPHHWSDGARAQQPAVQQPRTQGVVNAFATRPWQPAVQQQAQVFQQQQRAMQEQRAAQDQQRRQQVWQQQQQAAAQQQAWQQRQQAQVQVQQQQAWQQRVEQQRLQQQAIAQQQQRAVVQQQQPQRVARYPQPVMPGGWASPQQRGEVQQQRQQQGWNQHHEQRYERAAQSEDDRRGRGHRFN